MTASGGDKASSPHFFSSSCVQPGGQAFRLFFLPPCRPTTGRDGPCSVCGRPGAPRPGRCLGRWSALRPGRPRGGGPPAPGGGGLGQLRYAAGRVQAGPVLARPGRPRPNRSGPALSGPGPWALAAVGVGWWLAAGPPARGRPASGLVAGRLGAGGRSPPAGALCRGAVARSLAAAAWAWGWRPGLRPCPACA